MEDSVKVSQVIQAGCNSLSNFLVVPGSAICFYERGRLSLQTSCAAEVAPRTDRLALAESQLLRHAPRPHCLKARIKQK